MSKEELANGAPYRQRFKGIENFLKRIAFNLGNTPSQTEVKIISCIPIDVTDLQQKIIHLEKQLGESRGTPTVTKAGPPSVGGSQSSKPGWSAKVPSPNKTAVNTAILDSNYPRVSTAAISCKSLDCDHSTSPACLNSKKKKSNVSFLFPTIITNEEPLKPSDENCETSQSQIETNNMEPHDNSPTQMTSEPKPNENRRNFFIKKKKFTKNKNCKSPCIYYAQANYSPFNKSDVVEGVAQHDTGLMTHSYLAKMINKQYKPKLLGDNLSLISQFSKPICRDDQPHCEGTCRYESDVCSCCHGPYHNIDIKLSKFNNPQTYMFNEMNTGNAYYDTNQYDLVPVKEKSVKIKKDLDMPRKKEPRPRIDMKCWPESFQSRHRYYSYPPRINYQTVRPETDYIIRERLDNYVKKMPIKVNRIEPITKKVTKRRREIYKRDRPINIETSKSCSIEFGNVYHRTVNKKLNKKQEIVQPIPVIHKNAGCLTTVINNSECQTITSNLERDSSDAKTEATLNQIKNILQSVLAEVKVSSQTRNQLPEKKPKKDAVVQKGASQSNMQGSTFMNSITYSPYAMNHSPYNMTSCSKQLDPTQFCYPHNPHTGMKCFHNFPLFIPPPGRHICASCYRNSSHAKSAYMKHATTIATNTDEVRQERSKETDNLIKEIYKSMALTMDIHNKDTSLSEYDDTVKSVTGFSSPLIIKSEPKKQPKKIRSVVQAVSELFMKKDTMVETSDTHNTTNDSKLQTNYTSTPSQQVTTDSERRQRNEKLQKYLRTRNVRAATEAEKRAERPMIHTATTITESEISSSDAESETTLVHTKAAQEPKLQKEKQGLLKKMFKSVKLFKPKEKIRKKEERTDSDEVTSSDSDDYQTVYSQKTEKTRKHRKRAHNLPKRKTHSKISYKQTYQRERSPDKKRSPYMEQEYRRYWNERLMFHPDKPKHSSEQTYSEQTTRPKSAYYRTYETRNAFIEPKKIIPKTELRKVKISRQDNEQTKVAAKGMAWLKKHKMGIHCGEQWMKFLREG